VGIAEAMATAALLAALATTVVGALLLVGRFKGQEVPINFVSLHSMLGLTGVASWWLYTSGEGDRGRSIGAIFGGLVLVGTAILGGFMYKTLRGSFGSDERPPRSSAVRVLVLLHGIAALVTIVLVCIEIVDAWRSYSGNAPGVPTRSDTSAVVLLPVWIGAGLVVALVGHLVFRERLGDASIVGTLLTGALAGAAAGAIGYYGAGLSMPLTILAAALGAVFGWWWRLISFVGIDVDEGDEVNHA
jgi:hypothetical protein